MPVSTQIAANWNIPLFWANVDGSMAGVLNSLQPALLIGQRNTTPGTAVDNTPIPIASYAVAQNLFGNGSMLARMVKAFLACNTTQLLYAIAIPDPGAGVVAVGTILVASAPTQAGILTVYIAGQKVQVVVNSTDTVGNVATNLNAAINAIPDLPVTSTVTTATCTLTAKWKGATGNDITIIPNYLGPPGGEAFPVGLTLTVGPMAAGAGVPTFTNALSAVAAFEYDYVAMPYTDTASMASWNTEFGFGPTGRWNYTRQLYGMLMNANRDTFANLITFGLANNSPVMSTMAVETTAPSPVWEWSAAYCGTAALGFTDDPARPLQTLEFPGILGAPIATRFLQSQNNSLTNTGLAVQTIAPSGNPMILREQTQYQLNQYAQADSAFALLTVLATLSSLLRSMKSAITTKFPRVKLVPDGTAIGPGQAAVSPVDIKAELVAEYSAAIFAGLATNMVAFKNALIVEIDSVNPNRVNVLWPPQLAGQLRIFAALAQFRLLSPILTQ